MFPEDPEDPGGAGGAGPEGASPGGPLGGDDAEPAHEGGEKAREGLSFSGDDLTGGARPFEGRLTPAAAGSGEDRPAARSLNEREVKVLNIYQYEERSDYTFVLLQDGRGRKLPIWIGPEQAQSIFIALHKEQCDFHRPLTHDLLRNIVEKLGAHIERLTIDDMWQETFYARLVLRVGDRWIDVDCRPSDGIAVALRAEAPIYVAEEVLKLSED